MGHQKELERNREEKPILTELPSRVRLLCLFPQKQVVANAISVNERNLHTKDETKQVFSTFLKSTKGTSRCLMIP